VFYATYEQRGNTLVLWTADHSSEIPMTRFLVECHELRVAAAVPTSSIAKMAIGCFCLALAYLVLTVSAWQAGDGEASWLFARHVLVLVGLG
jgi:proton-dependent oligopeptide transporter, POT family